MSMSLTDFFIPKTPSMSLVPNESKKSNQSQVENSGYLEQVNVNAPIEKVRYEADKIKELCQEERPFSAIQYFLQFDHRDNFPAIRVKECFAFLIDAGFQQEALEFVGIFLKALNNLENIWLYEDSLSKLLDKEFEEGLNYARQWIPLLPSHHTISLIEKSYAKLNKNNPAAALEFAYSQFSNLHEENRGLEAHSLFQSIHKSLIKNNQVSKAQKFTQHCQELISDTKYRNLIDDHVFGNKIKLNQQEYDKWSKDFDERVRVSMDSQKYKAQQAAEKTAYYEKINEYRQLIQTRLSSGSESF